MGMVILSRFKETAAFFPLSLKLRLEVEPVVTRFFSCSDNRSGIEILPTTFHCTSPPPMRTPQTKRIEIHRD